ncbi:HAMP domain-containing histidine kinase [Eubacterium sp. MSJ-13]|uniref:sensor histidine kinase n=1 Tax=Eubacterium sp. MSJ-13 TaxID=2841513 RepID=UPI001C112EDD|nr:HAMP domain-containing sensor histidine kinase [Eubacterium sp. MSJ-13]MBU5478899.1 HAMP domain-containing histidine kinase [Eubacterium sp. MSJ-13]
MKHKISTQLSVGFAFIVFITIFIISLTANILINGQFEKYVVLQQKNFSKQLVSTLMSQYNSSNGEWNLDYVHGVGMYALKDGYIIKLYDREKNVIWDAENHDMTYCHDVMKEISNKMEKKRPGIEGSFLSHHYDLKQKSDIVGYLDVSYYSPFYYNDSDFRFLDSLNKILIVVGISSVILAAVAGVILARRLSVPLVKVTDITKKVSEGNYSIRFKEDVRTRELSELSESINHMAESLEKQETIRRRLTSDVAHELRTPVANVSSNLEAIIEGVWEPDTERLQSCYDELQRISEIISDLEKLRQIEDENMNLEKTAVDLYELVQAVRTVFEPELQKKHLNCVLNGETTVVQGDGKRLHQVIFNLLSNAAKYSTDGGNINISLKDNGQEMAVLIVEDEGIGISKEDIPLIFERFYRTDISRNRKTGGAGIGLTIVKAIVQAHNGKITVESKEGEGSRFIVELPKGIPA